MGVYHPIAEVHIQQGRIEECTVLDQLTSLPDATRRSDWYAVSLGEDLADVRSNQSFIFDHEHAASSKHRRFLL